ncbi:MAG TPA: DinB family protein [Terriglobales bacterium]|nr:DinB family protein [Terriglobales bacterium]
MKVICWGLTAAVVLLFANFAAAQAKTEEHLTVSQIMERSLKPVEGEFVPAADAMPEDKYSFAPTNGEFKGVRTFAQQVKHVAAVNYIVGSTILEEKLPVELGGENGPDSITSKADIMKFLKDSFAYLHKAMGSINEKNQTDLIKNPFGKDKVTRLGFATVGLWHPFDHYGQMVEYLRMNGIIPPASRGQ